MTILSRSAFAALFVVFSFVMIHLPPPVFAQEDPDSKGDVSTENNPNIGQMKEQKVIQDQKNNDRNNEKKEPSTGPDRPANAGHDETRTGRWRSRPLVHRLRQTLSPVEIYEVEHEASQSMPQEKSTKRPTSP